MALDRFVAIELRSFEPFPEAEARNQAVAELFAAARFTGLALFLERALQELARSYRWKNKGKLPPERFADWLERETSRSQAEDVAAVRERLLELTPEAYLGWARLRTGVGEKPRDSERTQLFEHAGRWFEATGKTRLEARMLWHGFPLGFLPMLEARARQSQWGARELDRFVENHAFSPPLWLRLNDPKKEDEVWAELEVERLSPERRDGAITVQGSKSVYALESFKRGLIEIQDLASQHIGGVVGVRPGERIWDACAGEGGKTLQLASLLSGKGFVYASDKFESKLDELKLRVRRTGISNIRVLSWTGETLPEFGREVEVGRGFDAVLVDAPCSSSGTWRRNPDAKLRFDLSEVRGFASLQLKILRAASEAVRPGGRLIYATCSWLLAENEDVVEAFLRSAPRFTLEKSTLLGSPSVDADTTFAAIFRKA